ncbi:protein SSUH2 homolog [Numenius arquata]|uniref:protein SSUH2 homolog n=1 Tax=Numenius arquata TaxID=31919 RepID=UPI003D305241
MPKQALRWVIGHPCDSMGLVVFILETCMNSPKYSLWAACVGDLDRGPEQGCPLMPSAPPGRLDDSGQMVQGRGAKPLPPPPLDWGDEPREWRSSPPFLQHRRSSERKPVVLPVPEGRPGEPPRAPRPPAAAAGEELPVRRLRRPGTSRYGLEMFSEARLSEWVFEPFTKPRAAGPPRDTPLDPWDVEVGTPQLFQGQMRHCWVLRSALVRDCHRCHGHGRSKCGVCHGAGRRRCVMCRGSRQRLEQQKRCQLCSGTGRGRCDTCSGRGSRTCATCQGKKKLQHLKQLVVTLKSNVFGFVSERHLNFPEKQLSKVSGANIFKDENVVVYPIVDFPDPQISLASQRAIAEHNAVLATTSPILWQRQTVELIPITEVHSRYSGKPDLYYVYGLENKVYALDYPKRCCWGCTLV